MTTPIIAAAPTTAGSCSFLNFHSNATAIMAINAVGISMTERLAIHDHRARDRPDGGSSDAIHKGNHSRHLDVFFTRSAERRGGKECVSTGRYRGSAFN